LGKQDDAFPGHDLDMKMRMKPRTLQHTTSPLPRTGECLSPWTDCASELLIRRRSLRRVETAMDSAQARLATTSAAAAASAAPATGCASASAVGDGIPDQFLVQQFMGGACRQNEPAHAVGLVDSDFRTQHHFHLGARRHFKVVLNQRCPWVRQQALHDLLVAPGASHDLIPHQLLRKLCDHPMLPPKGVTRKW